MIIHVDMDAFYASVEIRDNPALRGKPVVVGGSPQGRGVVTAASYVARQFGIHSAMPAARAIRLCHQAVFLRPRMEHYLTVSRQIREIFNRFTSLVEPISLDEAFLDVSGCQSLFGPAHEIAVRIKQTLQRELGLTASAGVAPNKFLAKVASDLDKPDGLVIVPRHEVQAFLDPLPIRRVWGIGPKTEERFRSLGISTVAGIRALPRDVLRRQFGVNSDHFWRLSRGLDSRPVVPEHQAKSISHETTFSVDIDNPETLQAWLQELAGQVAMRMRRLRVQGKTVQIKIRYSDFRTITRSQTLDDPTFATRPIGTAVRRLFQRVWAESPRPVRLAGAGVCGLSLNRPVQKTLFDEAEKQKHARIDQACDAVKQKFGHAAVRSGAALEQAVRIRRTSVTEDRQPSPGNGRD
jgi:DNA polymerase-4